MPIPDFPTLDSATPADRLSGFWWWVRDALASLQSEEYQHLFVPQLINPMRAAWEAAQHHFEVARPFLAEIPPVQIWLHGLHGPELDFKLAAVGYWAERFTANSSATLLRRLLNSIDTLLNSLLDAIGLGGAVQEIKDVIRDAITDDP